MNSDHQYPVAESYEWGRHEGERLGYVQGWRWGAACGAATATLLCGLAAKLLGAL